MLADPPPPGEGIRVCGTLTMTQWWVRNTLRYCALRAQPLPAWYFSVAACTAAFIAAPAVAYFEAASL